MSMEWNLLVPTISIHPEMATRADIARLAAELMEANRATIAAQKRIVELKGALDGLLDVLDYEHCKSQKLAVNVQGESVYYEDAVRQLQEAHTEAQNWNAAALYWQERWANVSEILRQVRKFILYEHEETGENPICPKCPDCKNCSAGGECTVEQVRHINECLAPRKTPSFDEMRKFMKEE